jgi:hypothetical protein
MLQESYGALLCSLGDRSQALESKQCALPRHLSDRQRMARRDVDSRRLAPGLLVTHPQGAKAKCQAPAKCTGAALA